jgi:hypothetical protein
VVRLLKAALILASVASLVFPATGFSATASFSGSQLALYQGADRERILIDGAKREGLFIDFLLSQEGQRLIM